ncbi:MAG: guanylate kinase [Mycoplasma sp.]
MKKGKLIILSGVSGVGKNAILNELFKDHTLNITYSTSMTTRPMRVGEVNGKNYFFVSNEEFDNAIENNELLEWAPFCENRYGTPNSFVEEQLNDGKNVILEIEVKGALNVMQKRPDAISIFLIPPSLDELRSRLEKRGTETEEIIDMRINEAKKELKFKDRYNHVVVNDVLVDAIKKVRKIIKSETK